MTHIPPEYFEYTQLLTMGVIFAFAIREFFLYLKTKKTNQNNTDYDSSYKKDIANINLQLTNHITEIEGKIDDIERDVGETKTDIKLIQKDVRDILIRLANKKK